MVSFTKISHFSLALVATARRHFWIKFDEVGEL